jgi:hypothetical protein
VGVARGESVNVWAVLQKSVPLVLTAVIDVAELTVKLVAAVLPKETDWPWVKLVPVMFTVVPPAMGPELGLTDVIVGCTSMPVLSRAPMSTTGVAWKAARLPISSETR